MADHLPPDRRLDPLARRQHGVFSRNQALAVGFSARQIDHRLRSGWWLRLDAAVYAIPSHPATWERQLMAATLSVPEAVACGGSAGRLHGFPDARTGRPEIVVAPGRNERSRLARVRRSPFVRATSVGAIPCQRPAVAVLELASRLGLVGTGDLIDHLALRSPAFLDELVDLYVAWAVGRRPGTRILRLLLDARSAQAWSPPESRLESRLRDVLDDPRLPQFEFQVAMPWWRSGSGRVDAYAADPGIVVEGDGRAWHARERDFARDRARDNLAIAHGQAVLRFTWFDVNHDVERCRRLVLATASARGWRGGGSTRA